MSSHSWGSQSWAHIARQNQELLTRALEKLAGAERCVAELKQEHRRATDEQIGFVARQRERLHLADAAAAEFRMALVFYADEANYDEETGAAGKWRRLPNTADDPGETVFEHDGGDVARAALLRDAGKNTLVEIERLKDQVNRLGYLFSDEREKTAAWEQRAVRAESDILIYARWVRAAFPPELEQSDAEQRLLDLADTLEAPT